MSSHEDYQAKIAIIEAIPDDQMKSPNMPVDHYIQEAENLYQWCLPDKEKLTAAGLDRKLIEDMPPRCGALREAESLWFKDRFGQEAAQKEWNKKSPAAYDLRDRLLHSFRYAFRNRPDLLDRVSDIAEGSAHADMIQDLNDLAVLGRENFDLVSAIKLDAANLDEASNIADEMANLFAASTAGREDNSAARIIRDKAFTYLKQAVDEVRACGQYVFWRDDSRSKGYGSAYFRRMRSRSSGKKQTEDTGLNEV